MARPERFELPTTWFVARYSIQLSYGRCEPCSMLWSRALVKRYAAVIGSPVVLRCNLCFAPSLTKPCRATVPCGSG